MADHENRRFQQRLESLVGVEAGPLVAWDEVNQAMIRHWCDAMDDTNPLYTDPDFANTSRFGGTVAPPTMLQAWTMKGWTGKAAPGSDAEGMEDWVDVMMDAGFISPVAVNCEQEYFRYLKPGDTLHHTETIESISPEKKTGLGVGHFVTRLLTYRDQNDEVVATMRFRILFYRPPEAEKAPEEGGDKNRAGTAS